MDLKQLGWNSHFENLFAEWSIQNLHPARVVRENRESYVVYGEQGPLRATVSGALRHQAVSREDFPAVGDWTAIQTPPTGGEARIHGLLPRTSAIKRKAAGEALSVQVIAANVDSLLICCGLDRDFNLRRIERYLTLAYNANVVPVVVLTKADLDDEASDKLEQVERVALGAVIHRVSVINGSGLDEVRRCIGLGTTVALVGSSGVGKSSLINALLGEATLQVGEVRAHDGRGRHTTTHRELLMIPGGGVIIDTPGMRELQLWGDEAGADATFGELDEYARQCRFRDCAHDGEPGCRVQEAVDSGELDAARLASFRKQQAELRWLATQDDPLIRAEEKARWKAIHKSARKHMKRKYGE